MTRQPKTPRASVDRCCTIHVGLPKTATTMLQAHLFARHSEIEYLGKFPRHGNEFRDAAVRRIITEVARGRVFNADLVHCRRLFAESIAPALEAGRIPLCSSEDFTVGGPRRRRARAENLRAVFGDCKVIITLRHPLRFVESMYLHKLRAVHLGAGWRVGRPPRYFGIDQWLSDDWRRPEKGELAHLEYAQTIEILADVFGESAVGIFLFEQLVEDPEEFVTSLCRFIGIDPEEGIRLASGKRENDRLTTAQVARIRTLERSFLQSTLFRFSPRALRRRMLTGGRADVNTSPPAARTQIPLHWEERFVELTRQGNRWLRERWGLPLDSYHYPL